MNLLIVESPSKAKTIEKYLGAGWRVIASVGHVRDLVPENGSVDTEHDFKMRWQIMPGKEKQIKQIMDELKRPMLYIWRPTRIERARPSHGTFWIY